MDWSPEHDVVVHIFHQKTGYLLGMGSQSAQMLNGMTGCVQALRALTETLPASGRSHQTASGGPGARRPRLQLLTLIAG